MAPTDTASELIELRQPEAIGAMNDHGVDVGNVDTVLDNRRGDEYVVLVGGESVHPSRQLALLELTVPDRDPHAGNELSKAVRNAIDRRHPVVDVVHLS